MATVTTKQDDVRKYIRTKIEKKFGTLSAFAEHAEAQRSHVSAFLGGSKPVPDWALEMFKVKKETVFTLPQ